MSKIASLLGCSATTIRRRLSELGISSRLRGPYTKRSRQLEWSPEIAYVTGLITTDGNLSSDGRHLSMVSADIDQLETVRSCLGLKNAIRLHTTSGYSPRFITGFNGVTRRFTNG